MLTGAEDYQYWSESIRTYLRTQGVWSSHSGRVVDGQHPHLSVPKEYFHDTDAAQTGHHRSTGFTLHQKDKARNWCPGLWSRTSATSEPDQRDRLLTLRMIIMIGTLQSQQSQHDQQALRPRVVCCCWPTCSHQDPSDVDYNVLEFSSA